MPVAARPDHPTAEGRGSAKTADISIKNLIGPNMELLNEEKMLVEENIVPGTTLTVVVVDQAAEDEKEAKECTFHIVTAAKRGKLGAVRHLLRSEPPGPIGMNTVGSGGWSALHAAAGNGHVEICRVLLAAKAEVDAISITFNETPLHVATFRAPYGRRVEVVKLLLEANASGEGQ
ncbi:ANKRD39 [Symbiodinium natans]|uniref:ANKRD39 protein n=1 Tax=Symbiodinium natans TaxID=878477 RepID=A0A812T968_9DINO|nr:ANKRD39 [Symbiodinium natans]